MKTAAIALIGLVLSVTLTACGGGDPEADARGELKDLGLSNAMTDCAIKEIKKEAGSLEKFMKLDASKQATLASAAGSKCSKNMTEEDIGDLADTLEDQDVDLSDPAIRSSIITGMTTQGVPTDVANCMLDKMIDEDMSASDILDAQVIATLAQACQ